MRLMFEDEAMVQFLCRVPMLFPWLPPHSYLCFALSLSLPFPVVTSLYIIGLVGIFTTHMAFRVVCSPCRLYAFWSRLLSSECFIRMSRTEFVGHA